MNAKLRLFLIVFQGVCPFLLCGQITEEKVKASLVYKLIEYVDWDNEPAMQSITITVLTQNGTFFGEFKRLELIGTVKNKTLIIRQSTSLSDLGVSDVLYVDAAYNDYIDLIWEEVTGKNVLLFTDQYPVLKKVMFNFKRNEEGIISFEFNKANIIFEGFTIQPRIIELKGDEIELHELYEQTKKRLADEAAKVNNLISKVEEQNIHIQRQLEQIKEMNLLMQQHTDTLKRQRQTIVEQQHTLTSLSREITRQRENVSNYTRQINSINSSLAGAQNELSTKQIEVEKYTLYLDSLETIVHQKQQFITEQASVLELRERQVKNQRFIIIISISLGVLVFFVVVLIYNAYRLKRNSNDMLNEKNQQLDKQRKQIEKYYDELREKNQNLTEAYNKVQEQKTALEETLQKLEKTQEQLIQSEKMASLGLMTSGLAHEINNPINFVSSGIQAFDVLLRRLRYVLEAYAKLTPENFLDELKNVQEVNEKYSLSALQNKIQAVFESIQTGVRRANEIIRSLQIYSSTGGDQFVDYPIAELIESTLVLLRPQCKNRIEIVKDYSAAPSIQCLPGRLNQVFMNLFSNAIDAIHDTGRIKISISELPDRDSIRVSISDTGQGMDAQVRRHIFDPFYTTKEVGKGTGLGLYITFGIIKQHNGTIDVASSPGKGSIFSLTLPLMQK